MLMKKCLFLMMVLLSFGGLTVKAQSFEFQYQGQSLKDGDMVTIAAEGNIFGELACETNPSTNPNNGLVLKLLSSSTANARAELQITHNTLKAQMLQWCMGGECVPVNDTKAFTKQFTATENVQVQFDATNIQSKGYLLATLKATVGEETHQVTIQFTNGESANAQTQVWWGYFGESDFEVLDTSIGIGTPAPFMAGIRIPANHKQVGSATVKAVRVYIVDGLPSTISDMKVWISKTLPTTPSEADYVQSITGSLKNGANDFTLTTPYAVNNQAFYIGYYINSSNAYPVRCGGEDAPNAFFISSPGYMDWADLNGNGFGKLAFQILVDGATLNSNCASIADFAPMVASPGQDVEVPVKISNGGENDITNISYTVKVNGKTSEERTINTPSISLNGTRQVNLIVTTSPVEGEFTYTITITKVNGNPNTSTKPSASGTIATIANLKTFPRNVLIEEFTTEQCVYCPDAAAGLHSFLTSYPDLASRVAVVCHHAGFYTDWLTIDASEQYTWFYGGGGTYAPAFMYDRYAWDGKTPVVSRDGYKESVEARIAKTSYANIKLTANFNADKSAINVTADCERGWNFSSTPARITLFLTEDNIKARSQSGGGSSFIHQHVLRSVNDTWGKVLNWSDNNASYTYTFNLDASWKKEDLKVVAIISGFDSSNVTNCVVENAAAVVPGTETGITGYPVENVREAGRYNLDGRQVSAPQRGLNIIRMSDGSIKKVIVR